MDSRLLRDLKSLLGSDGVLHRPEELLLYEYDGSVEVARPNCVVFPRTTADVLGIVKLANQYQIPLVGRGAGTGLSGGALSRKGGILTVFSRMNRILEIDIENQRATVQPGVVNSDLARRWRTRVCILRPTHPARKHARLAETFPKIPAGRIPWLTA